MLVVRADELDYRALPGRLAADPLSGAAESGMSARFVRVPPGPRAPHLHLHSSELIYVLEGRGVHRQGAEARAVRAGDLVLVPAGVPHCTAARANAPLLLLCVFPHPDPNANAHEASRGDHVQHKFLIHQRGDHVGVAVEPIAAGEQVVGVFMDDESTIEVAAGGNVPLGHKIAIEPVAADAAVLKYGIRVGTATQPLGVGDYVHTHNLKSARW